MKTSAGRVFAVLLGAAGLLAAGGASAKNLSIIAPELPPMLTKDGKGREADLIGESLAACGHQVTFTVVPFGRHWADFKNGQYDAVATVPPGMDLGGAASNPYIHYQNGASVLKSSGLQAKSLADLKGKRVITFVGGKDILPGVKDAAGGFAEFREQADQLVHSNLLFAKRVEAVLSDGVIFAEYNRQLQAKVKAGESLQFDPNQEVAFTAIFPPSPYTMVFKDAAVRDDFNRCFGELKSKGRVDAINKATVEPYRATVGNQYLGY